MKKHKFKVLSLVITAALFTHSALADPGSYTHHNGFSVVDINKADANGLSHNMWKEFNVTNNGMVLNNSTENTLRPNGNVPKNNNLTDAAKIILNEVISDRASTLNGYIDVVGQKADVIIANPNGITCSGCSFINTGRATLTTGTPTFTNGALTGFNVANGNVTVNGQGLANEGYTDILARNIRIQGKIATGELKAIAGVYSYDSASSVATSSKTTLWNTGVDVSALGGVTADVIRLQTTDVGSGVNNSGILLGDNLQISSNGALTNGGTITATAAGLQSAGNMTNNGAITSTSLQAYTGGALINYGAISVKNASLMANNILTNNGTLTADEQLSAVALNKISNEKTGKISTGKMLQLVSYKGDVENKGEIDSQGNVLAQTGFNTIDGATVIVSDNVRVINSGTLNAKNNVSLAATKEIALNSGVLTAGGTTYLTAASVTNAATVDSKDLTVYASFVKNTGVMQATDHLNVTGNSGIENTGTLQSGEMTLKSDGKISNERCLWFCNRGTLTADKIIVNAAAMNKVNELGGNIYTPTFEMNVPASSTEAQKSVTDNE